MSLGQIIRKRREELNLTLDEVSHQTGFSKPYISTIETGKVKNPPGDDLLVKLEAVLQFEQGSLVYIAHMEKLPADIRQAYENNEAELKHLRSVIKQVMSQPNSAQEILGSQRLAAEPLDNIVPLHTAGQLVPIINNLSAGYPVDYNDKDYPVGVADDYVRCPDLHDPNAFAVRVVGDSMEPKYRQGDIIIFSPAVEVRNGDDCFIRMTDPHETTFKQIYMESEEHIRLQPRNNKYPPLMLSRKRVNGVWRAISRYEKLS